MAHQEFSSTQFPSVKDEYMFLPSVKTSVRQIKILPMQI